MPCYTRRGSRANFQTVLDSFAQAPDLPFQEVLTADHIERVAAEEGVEFGSGPGTIYSVAVTLWAFLAQVLSKEKACVAAVARIMVLHVALGREPCAEETGAYCKARAKLPVRTLVSTPGCRTKELVVVTTLLNAQAYPKDDITDLYHERWHVELDLRSIKTHLHMDILRCKTPPMVRKEIWTHFLAYNLTRQVMAQAALAGGVHPRQSSFMGAVQTLNEFRLLLVTATVEGRRVQAQIIFAAIVSHRVGHRPDRCEPRAVKRRPKPLRYLNKPRAEARAELLR